MKLYAEIPLYRARQLLVDAFVVAWVVAWVRIGSKVHSLIESLTRPGRLIEGAGSDLARGAGRAGENVEGVPLVGGALSSPFESIAQVGRLLENAGQDQQEVVHSLALWLGILLAAIPILFVLYHWIVRRWRWVREASAAERIRIGGAGLHLFALRALATRPITELRKATPDPAGAYASGDYAPLADLELRELGLRPVRPLRPLR